VRRQGLIAARARFLGVLKKSHAYQGLAPKNTVSLVSLALLRNRD
jgi:hypothetical protein